MRRNNYQKNWDRIFNKQRKQSNIQFKMPELIEEDEFDIRWRQLRQSNSRDHVTSEIKKMTKKFIKWQKKL